MSTISGILSVGRDWVLSEDCEISVGESAVVKDASGKVIGKVLSAEMRAGHVYATMEVDDEEVAEMIGK